MNPKKEDRRVERTRMLLHEALMALILEKGYESVTVQDILDRANLGRSTFYCHYRDKDDLFLKGFDHLHSMLERQHAVAQESGADNPAGFNLSLELFRHAQQNYRLYKALVGRQSGQMLTSHAHTLLTAFVRTHLTDLCTGSKNGPASAELLAHWLASSFLSLLTWWLDNNLPCSAEEIDTLFRKLSLPGVESVIGQSLSH
ncbi:MAG: TetR/AcrR family transcriptional regulator [Geobacter sp.]|nr:TetR/AcrR family transcriptional regulator [Geobacter sp.]